MTYKVVATYEHPIVPLDAEIFRQMGAEFTQKVCQSEDDVIAVAGDADIIITLIEPFTKKVIESLPKCRLIMTPKVGVENIDLASATEHGVLVANAGDYSKEEVSDHAMALLLACARKICRLDRAAREGKWTGTMNQEIRQIWIPTFRLSGHTLGMIGLGRIGRALVPKAKGFGLKIITYDPYVSKDSIRESGVELVELDYLLRESDYISIHAVSTKDNYHLLGIEQFKKMKPTAYIINTARGALIDEQALYTALTENYIAGAGLDVLEAEYVNSDNPLLILDNVIISCHSAHVSNESTARLPYLPGEEVARIIRGKLPHALVNPQAKEKYQQKWGDFK